MAFAAVPALCLIILCSRMLAGASTASTMIGSVVEDVEMAVDVSSGAAFALEMTIASACVTVQKSHVLVCRVVSTGVLCSWFQCVLLTIHVSSVKVARQESV